MTVQLHSGKTKQGFFDVWRVVPYDEGGFDNEVWGETGKQEAK